MGFGVQKILDFLLFLFLFTDIGLNIKDKIRDHHEYLDLLRFFIKN